MKDDFQPEAGYEIVINPETGQPDWVLSYRDLLNLHLNGSFDTTGPTPFSTARQDGHKLAGKQEVFKILEIKKKCYFLKLVLSIHL